MSCKAVTINRLRRHFIISEHQSERNNSSELPKEYKLANNFVVTEKRALAGHLSHLRSFFLDLVNIIASTLLYCGKISSSYKQYGWGIFSCVARSYGNFPGIRRYDYISAFV